MADFSHLKALEVTAGRTAEYKIHQITVNERTPALTVGPATEANKPYFNVLLRRAGRSARTIRAGTISASLVSENREEDLELYSKFVIKGWTDMVDCSTGKDVKFSADECRQFLQELPDWLFDDLRNFCGNPANFTEQMNVEIVAGN